MQPVRCGAFCCFVQQLRCFGKRMYSFVAAGCVSERMMLGSMERLSRTLAVYKGQFCHSFATLGRTDLSHMCSFVLVETRSLVGLSQGWKMYLQRCLSGPVYVFDDGCSTVEMVRVCSTESQMTKGCVCSVKGSREGVRKASRLLNAF